MIHVSENLLHILHRTRFFTMADCQNLQAQVGRLLLGPLRSWRGSTCHQKFHRRNIPSDAAEMKRQWAQLSNQSREMPWTWSTLLIFLASFPNLDWIVILLAIACSGGGSCCHDSSRHGWACPEASRGRIVCNYVLVSQGLCSPNHELESLMNSIQILAHSAVIQADLPIFPVYIVLPARSAHAWHQPCGIEGWVGNGASCCSLGCGSCMQIGEECWECPPHIFRSALCHTRYVLDHIRMMMIRSLQKMPNDWPNDQVSPGDRFVGWIRHPASWPTFFLLWCFDPPTYCVGFFFWPCRGSVDIKYFPCIYVGTNLRHVRMCFRRQFWRVGCDQFCTCDFEVLTSRQKFDLVLEAWWMSCTPETFFWSNWLGSTDSDDSAIYNPFTSTYRHRLEL